MIQIANLIFIMETYFYILKRINIGLFAVETLQEFIYMLKIYMRDAYTDSIINSFFKAQNESYQMTHAVKTVKNILHGVDMRDIQ